MQTSPDGATTTWQVSSPITQEQLPLGTYTIAVQASDTGSDSTDNTDAGTLAFFVYPEVALSVSPTTFSYSQDVTLSGTDIGLYPDGSTAPVAGQEVGDFGQSTVTNSAGQFSLTVQAGVGAADFMFGTVAVEAVAEGTTIGGFSNAVPVTVTLVPLRVTLSPLQSSLNWPNGASFLGAVSYEIGTSWLPWPNFKSLRGYVYGTQGEPYGYLAAGSLTPVDSSGEFTATYGPANTTRYEAQAHLTGNQPHWFMPVAESVEIPVRHVATRFNYFTHTAQPRGRVKFSGCINDIMEYGRIFADPSEMASFPAAKFQYAASKNGPWRTVSGAGTVKASRTVTTRSIRACYQSATVKKPSGANWYRFLVPSDTAWLGTHSGPQRA